MRIFRRNSNLSLILLLLILFYALLVWMSFFYFSESNRTASSALELFYWKHYRNDEDDLRGNEIKLKPDQNAVSYIDQEIAYVNKTEEQKDIDVKKELDLLEKIDWHDREFIRKESQRTGNGEQGEPATFPPDYDGSECDKDDIAKKIGYNGCLSDYISFERSMPDTRPEGCSNITYRRHLPIASVIIPCHNEHWSVLMRALYSILNRSPNELLKEVIIVDDGSTEPQMKEQLDEYIARYLPKVRVLRVPLPRKGLMAARMLGARNATGEVLVFLDSNLETNVNWLPPLLEMIAENRQICVCPVVDVIDTKTFEIRGVGQGLRHIFDWTLTWRFTSVLPEDLLNPTKPFKSPVMIGCAFAISASYFWELGAYDRGLQLWGGEQYELAFKLWLCGGALLDIPCSRVAHLFRDGGQPFKNPDGVGDYLGRNLRRVADVWMDEYAEYFYMRRGHCRLIDPGDLTEQRELRQKLNCKPFKWFMENIAFDLVEKYPLIDPPNYGSGKIVPLLNPELCLTATISDKRVDLQNCSLTEDEDLRQKFHLSWKKNIKVGGTFDCLEFSDHSSAKAPVLLSQCREFIGNQVWRYNLEKQQIQFGYKGKRCLAYDPQTRAVFVEKCQGVSPTQKWTIETVNADALEKWDETLPLVTQIMWT